MKRLKKLLTIWLAILLTFCVSVSFVACGEEESVLGPIPDGTYYCLDINGDISTYIYAETISSDLYWIIEGDDAYFYISGSFDQAAKVVEKDGEIYIECYKWITIIDIFEDLLLWEWPEKEGSTNIYLVNYNSERKILTLELYKKGE